MVIILDTYVIFLVPVLFILVFFYKMYVYLAIVVACVILFIGHTSGKTPRTIIIASGAISNKTYYYYL